MIGVDLFSGAGGLSLGASAAGISVAIAVEANRHAAETYAHNHKEVRVLASRVENLTRCDFRDLPRRQPIIVFGGPPCRGFSTSNQRTRTAHNPDNWLFKHFIRVVRLIRPDWVVFENVTGILQTEGGRFVRSVAASLDSMGYDVSQWVLNASDFGVPQRRSRLFLIGSRDRSPSPPSATVCKPVTVGEAISDLPVLANGAQADCLPYSTPPVSPYSRSMRGELTASTNHFVTRSAANIIRRYSHVPPGGNWRCIPKALMRNYSHRDGCHEWIYRRLRPDEPSVVIGNYRKNMLIHPSEDRGLSVREAARLQSFPDWFQFFGSIGFQQQQVGNAVPPLLARAVFRTVMIAAGEAGGPSLDE